MKSNIFIPQKINVGYQNRSDTYTGKLAYVIYYDEQGKLRKEKSWNSWRNEDIPNNEFENVPTEGFVLNKKVGDYNDWYHRQAYIRVYDPRNFEFEITVENLLYILENTSSIKGKGLDGQFIYGWEGKELILIPVNSPDYKEIQEYNKLLFNEEKIGARDLIKGYTYLTKDSEEWVYLGKFNYNNKKWNREDREYIIKKQNRFWFARKYNWNDKEYITFLQLSSIPKGKFIKVIDNTINKDYSKFIIKMENDTDYSAIDENKNVFKEVNEGYIIDYFTKGSYKQNLCLFIENNKNKRIVIKNELNENNMIKGYIQKYINNPRYGYDRWSSKYMWYKTEEFDNSTLEKIIDKYKPQVMERYLENGNYYSTVEADI